MNTFVKFYRQLLDNDFLIRDNNAYLVFTKLLLRVNWKTGSLTTGRYKFSLLVNLKPTTAYATLQRLENAGMVTLHSDRVSTKITVVNWKKFQGVDRLDDNLMTTSRQLDDTINNNKIIKEEKNNTNVLGIKPQYGNSDVNTVMDKLYNYLEVKPVRIPKQRIAATNLIRRHGLDNTLKLIEAYQYLQQSDIYTVKVASMEDLWNKQNDILLQIKKKKSNQVTRI